MVILSQDKKSLVNFDNVFKISTENKYVCCKSDGFSCWLGNYTSEERCMDIIRDIGLHNCSDCGKYVIYTMPEE